jgi:hypothetical protein
VRDDRDVITAAGLAAEEAQHHELPAHRAAGRGPQQNAHHRVAHPHHRRAHVILCWLALLLARVAENACAATWPELRRQLDRIQVGTFNGRPFYSALLPAPPYIS